MEGLVNAPMKFRGISCRDEDLFVSQEGPCPVELFS